MSLSSSWVAVLALLACSAVAVPVELSWVKTGYASPSDELRLVMAVKMEAQVVKALEDKAAAVSDPLSSVYGQYWTMEQLWKNVRGAESSRSALLRQLEQHGASNIRESNDGSFILANIAVADAQNMFGQQFYTFEHPHHNISVSRCLSAELPSSIKRHVDFVLGHNKLPNFKRMQAKVSEEREPDASGVTPDTIDTTYNMNGYVSTNTSNSQAIASFLKQYFNKQDLEDFQKKFNLPVRPISKIEGLDIDADPGVEAALDVEYVSTAGRGVSTWFVSTSKTANDGQEDFLYWVIGQLNETSSPWVHSVSYGDVEADIPADYKMRVDLEFQKFGVTGRSVLIAAGDSGVSCHDNTEFWPDWPTSSPHITSVGGTSGVPESVWNFGGGGFSNFYAQPSWQSAAVQSYVSSGSAPASHFYNSSGRAYPDVAAFANNVEIVYRGNTAGVAGTSCATPIFAGVVSALNDIRLNHGLGPLGFLNPMLYQLGASHGSAFNDITRGSNPSGRCPGFQATTGWDPASGWGSPNFAQLRQLVLSL